MAEGVFMKSFIALILSVVLFVGACPRNVKAEETEVQIQSPSGILMEVSTGKILYAKDADTKRPPASVTKIMTMLLIFDALEEGKIRLDDTVTTSEYAASMGGSQVFLEPGETQTVDTLLKCISIASANDACVTMAEYLCGSEEEFVKKMNDRARQLGMEHTNFVNCNGLDVDGHVTTAKDIALMSRELLLKYPQIHDYCTVWMEEITHTTKKGSSQFGLTNTNKLIRQYEYATGLKTGSTGLAKFCVSASAKKDNIELIAVIMAADDSKTRFKDATTLLNYGFSKCQLYEDHKRKNLPELCVTGGVKENVSCEYDGEFRYLDLDGKNINGITKTLYMKEKLRAPVKKGQKAGKLVYRLDGNEIGYLDVITTEPVRKARYIDCIRKILFQYRI